MADVVLKIDADSSKAVSETVRLEQSQDRVSRSTKRVSDATRVANREQAQASLLVRKTNEMYTSMVGTLTKFATAGFAVSAIKSIAESYSEAMQVIARKTSESSGMAQQLAVQLTGKGMSANQAKNYIRMAQTLTASFARPQGEGMNLGQEFLSTTGDPKRTLALMREALKVTRLDVNAEDVQSIFRYGLSHDLSSKQTSNLFLGVARQSPLSAKDVAPLFGRALAPWTDPVMGGAALTTLAKGGAYGNNPRILAAQLRGAAATLNLDNGTTRMLAKKAKGENLDYDTMTEMDRLGFLRKQFSPGTIQKADLQKMKVTDVSAVFGLTELLNNYEDMKKTYENLQSYNQDNAPSLVDQMIKTAATANPEGLRAFELKRQQQLADLEKTFGRKARKAQEGQILQTAGGRALNLIGAQWLVDQETNKPIGPAKLIPKIFASKDDKSAIVDTVNMIDPFEKSTGPLLSETMSALTAALQANTEVTKQNTKATTKIVRLPGEAPVMNYNDEEIE